MLKTWAKAGTVVLVVVAVMFATLWAQGLVGGRWWRRPQIARSLGLQGNQPFQIDSVFRRHEPEFKNLRRELADQDLELKQLLGQETLDRDRILKTIEAVEQTRYRLAKQRALMLFGVREVLSLEQWNRLQVLNNRRQGPPEQPQ